MSVASIPDSQGIRSLAERPVSCNCAGKRKDHLLVCVYHYQGMRPMGFEVTGPRINPAQQSMSIGARMQSYADPTGKTFHSLV